MKGSEFYHLGKKVGEEESDPDTFAPVLGADGGHAVVPIATAHERKAVRADAGKGTVDGAAEVLVECGGINTAAIVEATFVLARGELVSLAEGHLLREDGGIASDGDILIGDKDKPEVVVGEGGTSTHVETLVPPMEYVAFGELVGRMVENLTTRVSRIGIKHRHNFLKLVAETCGATDLIESGAGKEARGIDLVEVPSVEHVVEGGVGGVDLEGGELVVPIVEDAGEFGVDFVG